MVHSRMGRAPARMLMAGVCAMAIAPVAAAQDDSTAPAARDERDTIVVTATRREKQLKDVPMSINAFGDEALKDSGASDFRDLQLLAAGLHVNNSNGQTAVAIRGIGSNRVFAGAESSVAVHLDGVNLGQITEFGLSFYDVERIEVLRGPQGTLYGRNATGGAINLITKAPTPEPEFGARLTVGNFDLVETEGYASGPLIGDRVLGRIAFKTRDHDGYTPNIFDGSSVDDEDFAGVRGKLRVLVSDTFRVDLNADYLRDEGVPIYVYRHGYWDTPLTGETMGSVLPEGRAVNYNDANINSKDAAGVNLTAQWDLDGVTLKSITGYRTHDWFWATDWDGSDQSLFYIEGYEKSARQLSQELTAASSGSGPIEWVGGLFYFNNRDDWSSATNVFGTTYSGASEWDISAYAVFGEASFRLADPLEVTVGARYSYEEKELHSWSPTAGDFFNDDAWSSFTPKVAVTYDLSDTVSAYATIGKGFQAGSFNGTQESALSPEYVINYEAGLKGSFFGGRADAALAAFHMDYTDLQVFTQRVNPDTMLPETVLDNAATARIDGAEFEFRADLTDSLSLDGNVSWLDATFGDWPDAVNVLSGSLENAAGNPMLNAPEWAANLAASYTVPVGSWGSATLRGEYNYKGRVYFDPFPSDFLSQEAVGLYNARLSFEQADGGWRIDVWGKNLSDELVTTRIFQSASALTGRPAGYAYLNPRVYGITVGREF